MGNLGSDTTIYRKPIQDQLDNEKIKQETDNHTSPERQNRKISVWQKIKKILKNFFGTPTQEEKLENMLLPTEDDRASKFRQQVIKAAPQIDLEEIKKRKLENTRKNIALDKTKE